MSTLAKAKALRISPRKMNLVAGLVRRRSVDDAMVILDHTPKRAADMLKEVIKSAVANAEHNDGLDRRDLYLAEILVSPGFTMKRGRPIAGGRFHEIKKRTTHVTVTVDTMDEPLETEAEPETANVTAEQEE